MSTSRDISMQLYMQEIPQTLQHTVMCDMWGGQSIIATYTCP